MSSMVEFALQYAGRGWPVFRLSRSKKPYKGSRGFKDATVDVSTIEQWWQEKPEANIGLATGAGLIVLDVDGEAGLAELKTLVALHGPLPRTLTARTGKGYHIYLAGEGVRSSARGNLHVRGEGGYCMIPPSLHPNGRRYEWVDALATVAPLPDWLKEWMTNGGDTRQKTVGAVTASAVPAYLARLPARGLAALALSAIKTAETTYSQREFDRIKSALAVIPAVSREIWVRVGMILKELQWVRSDGTDIGFELWDEWSQTAPEKYKGVADQEYYWNSFGRREGARLGLASLFLLAQQHNWKEVMPFALAGPETGNATTQPYDAQPHLGSGLGGAHFFVNGHESVSATLPLQFAEPSGQILMPDRDKFGKYKATCRNVRDALGILDIECSYDMFAEQPLIYGTLLQEYQGNMSDPAVLVFRQRLEERFNLDAGDDRVRDAMLQDAYAHSFNPVLDYLDELQWDGRERLASWMHVYLGADHNKLNTEIGAKTLVAAVRRARAPGTKFDQLVVLEGKQGSGKTTALKILAGPDHYSDQSVLAVADREQQEALRGVWIHEISELTGIRRAAVDKIKHFLSRTEDRARPAFGHFRVDLKRRCICIGTTNDDEYLKDETGNRRFWPVVTREIDTERLARDRDMLWAEAARLESQGYSIELDRSLWAAIGEIQEQRTEHDTWGELVGKHIANLSDVSINEVLTGAHFMMAAKDINQAHQNRIARALKQLGFRRYRESSENRPWRYRKVRQWDT